MFNLEVDADHCYRVGEQGILVHNASGEKAKLQHKANDSESQRVCKNDSNVEWYFDNIRGTTILQIAAGTNVYKGALALDIEPYQGYTAVLVRTDEKYNQMPWFTNRKFDRIILVNALNDPETNEDYGWIFASAAILKSGGELRVTAASPLAPSLKYARKKETLDFIRGLGLELVTTGTVETKYGPVLGEPETDKGITSLPVESKSNIIRQLMNRPEPEGVTFTVQRGDSGSNFRDTRITFRKK